jgi:hypothetical protein
VPAQACNAIGGRKSDRVTLITVHYFTRIRLSDGSQLCTQTSEPVKRRWMGKSVVHFGSGVGDPRLWKILCLNLRIVFVTCLAFSVIPFSRAQRNAVVMWKPVCVTCIHTGTTWVTRLCHDILLAKSWLGELGLFESDLSAWFARVWVHGLARGVGGNVFSYQKLVWQPAVIVPRYAVLEGSVPLFVWSWSS